MLNFTLLFAQTADEKEIHRNIESMFQIIFSDLDETKIPNYFTSDVQIYENGEIYNFDSIQTFIINQKNMFNSEENKNNQFNRLNKLEFLSTKIKGNQAFVGFYNSATFTMNEMEIAKMKWLESAILLKTNEGWKIEFLHSTEIKPKL